MNKNYKNPIGQVLKEQSQILPPADGFDAIMDQIHQQKRRRSFRLPAIAASLLAVFLSWQLLQPNTQTHINDDQLKQLALLTEKITLIEYTVRNEVINHTKPGSSVIEKMISMENWLDQLDQNIAHTDDPSQKIELLHAKLEILDDLVALHQQIKPQNPQLVI